MDRPNSPRLILGRHPCRRPRWSHICASSVPTSAFDQRASPIATAHAINIAWCVMPSPHTSASTDSSYDSATPEVTTK
ncbi:hypothetical protein GW17_00013536, partial [Ensete ventricosum]